MSEIASAADPVRDSGGLMRLLVSRLLIGLLVSGWLNIDFGRGIAKLALELILGLLEFSQALAETTRKLGKLFRSEQQHYDDKNEESFRPTGHAEGDWEVH
jgi:hypothetical protein